MPRLNTLQQTPPNADQRLVHGIDGPAQLDCHLLGADRRAAVATSNQLEVVSFKPCDAIIEEIAVRLQFVAHREAQVAQRLQQRLVEEEAIAALDAAEVLHFQGATRQAQATKSVPG